MPRTNNKDNRELLVLSASQTRIESLDVQPSWELLTTGKLPANRCQLIDGGVEQARIECQLMEIDAHREPDIRTFEINKFQFAN